MLWLSEHILIYPYPCRFLQIVVPCILYIINCICVFRSGCKFIKSICRILVAFDVAMCLSRFALSIKHTIRGGYLISLYDNMHDHAKSDFALLC